MQKAKSQGPDIGRLVAVFLAWKALLLLIASASPGPGYDTSSQILFSKYGLQTSQQSSSAAAIEHVVLRLTRWDGVYFATSSAHGHVFEQEWAFSWTLARSTSMLSRIFLSSFPCSHMVKHALAGILVAHISHLLSFIVLYHLTRRLIPKPQHRIAYIAAILHIVSPAGLFLSGPYAEAPFAMLNFTGMLTYTLATETTSNIPRTTFWTITTGLLFAASATLRSNGILNGLIFAWDAVALLSSPTALLTNPSLASRLAATLAAGTLTALGFAAPQIIAYLEFCTNDNTRPWCSKFPPSIYSWVQTYYWEVGFLKYWTLSNAPLFLLAGPMLAVLFYTGYIALRRRQILVNVQHPATDATTRCELLNHILPRFALVQVHLAGLAASSFHVQIINRISSGYPVWYIVVAIALGRERQQQGATKGSVKSRLSVFDDERVLRWMVKGSIIYAIVQAGLYASFLPPA